MCEKENSIWKYNKSEKYKKRLFSILATGVNSDSFNLFEVFRLNDKNVNAMHIFRTDIDSIDVKRSLSLI